MTQDTLVQKVRAFNRFYMPAMHLLGNHYLGSEYSVTEARVFYEIYNNEGCTAAHIAQIMNIDKSYLSRIIAAHERNGYLYKQVSQTDRRAQQLYLTDSGKARAEVFFKTSDQEISAVIQHLTEDDRRQMYAALDTIITLLQKGANHENHSL